MIFIVDDDQSVRTSLTRLLRSAGYAAQAFAAAKEYLDYAAGIGTAGSCVILDLLGTCASGALLQEVIDRGEPPMPVIILSASEDVELRANALAAGVARVLRKPCDSTVLLQAVAEVLGQPAPPSVPRRGPPIRSHSGEFGTGRTGLDDPDNFVLEEGRGIYRPAGCVTFDEAVALVRAAIAAARRNQVRDLLVNTTALTGFASPDTFERFLAAVAWAKESSEGVRLAMVARVEMIHPQKFGVLVAANRGLVSNIFTTEVGARAWLDAWDRQ